MDCSEQETLRILILDDNVAVRGAMRRIILAERFGPMEFDEGLAGPEGLDLALSQPWDLVIIREGIDVLADLKRVLPNQLILILSVTGIEGQVANHLDDLA
jgi:response regulator RpfG family c-di-GMP phosphodiesterase